MTRYASLAEVKLYRGIPTDTTSDDALLTALIARACSAIDHYCHRVFEAPTTASTHYFDAIRDISDDRRTLYLDEDLCSITTITNNNATSTAVATTHYTTEPRNVTPYYAIRLNWRADSLWTWSEAPEDAITVYGRWGYATTVPDDIKHATIRLTNYLYSQKDASVFDVTVYPDSGVMTVPQGMPRDVQVILDPYRKLR
jgi:hypothetical protein